MMSRTDHAPVTLGIISCSSVNPAYDASNSFHAFSSRSSTCSVFTVRSHGLAYAQSYAKSAAIVRSMTPPEPLRLQYRSPYDWPRMLRFLGARSVKGVEAVHCDSYL